MLKFELNVEERKTLAKRMEELTGIHPYYTKAPRYAYDIGNYTIDRDGNLLVEAENANLELLTTLMNEGLIRGGEDVDAETLQETADEQPAVDLAEGVQMIPAVGEYGITAEEIMAAGAMKFYLQSMKPAEALKKVAAVYEPKVIRLDSGEGVPVQSIIDGAKYAAFIDEAVRFAAQKMRDGIVAEELKDVDGKHMVECASVEFMSFIEDAYLCLR